MDVNAFDYDLPEELIAQTPLPDRSQSRLMVVDPVTGSVSHARFAEILAYLRPGDVLLLNNSKVIPARLFGTKADTGARIELLLTQQRSETEWEVLAKPAKRLRVGTRIYFPSPDAQPTDAPPYAEVIGEQEGGIRHVRFTLDEPMFSFLDRVGVMPLPPYIHEPLADRDRYQTVYASPPGSVAAPTAGLHFTPALLEEIQRAGVEIYYLTLHVGIGTFRPVTVDKVEAHQMHSEWYEVPPETAAAVNRAKREGRRVIAVGTTAMRTLESAGASGEVKGGADDTDIFIYPGYKFRIVDALITNFHLPKSTLLMLVAAMMGLDFTKRVYETAVAERYRFFSFGDAMFITRRCET
ncbi:tRNA preQ1(34) S-adenosylmethionine ribosyltransferase-isomerase QueA [Alicyclobacillus cycloheptanicus]|uniref:S-adenosylmethionine:tRNA ribosyltransferase-isomerase n=1 Tax=Alicyclobacillus cycloheptanicus TaxID=1457 RepID=A0ABT9XEK9_9BACL|nr:tRNA preQ1(34) S-adenosylmethionine ribosyltransferase-isomerase QueA [Alicyclobacillus cycloheptanicus]MDQ0188738.1 S-adenosylmethionine:tRNA ribosyltransferase-isomerase [Alicyclobacillus cycloheptanicus]WDM00601.1 tRNA preQ1(34) S-adenosylmethionine ribosyltransferase-isomerase QueA [Alicyclobacillus cycloheptanicus]